MENQAEIVREIMDGIEMPTGKETVYFPKGDSLPKANTDYKGKGFVANLDHRQMTLLGQEISKKVGERYTLLPLQKSYNLVHSDKKFKKMNVDYWLHNEEVILEKLEKMEKVFGGIIAHPTVKEVGSKLEYDGEKIKAEINTNDVFDTLKKAGLMKEPKKKVYRGSVYFEDGESSVGSDWGSGGGCFGADADGPSRGDAAGVAAFVKTGETVEKPKMRQVAESEYQELLGIKKEHEALLKELEPVKKYF